ncbi:MAG: glycosyltransferase family 4 protein, partial [Candidatus Eiseniibacteriota bacterium]
LYNGMPGPGYELASSLEAPNMRLVSEWFRWRRIPTPVLWRPYPRRLTEAAAGAQVFHVGDLVLPRPAPAAAVVATVHDLTTKLFPRLHRLANRWLHAQRLGWVVRHATRIVVDAECTRGDIARILGVGAERVDVVPLAAGIDGTSAVGAEALAAVRARYSLGDAPYVLYAGTLEPRKNLVRLVEAFASLPPDCAAVRLVLAGGWGWHTGPLRHALARSPACGRTTVTGPLAEDALRALYAGATLFVYPSLYEGFGLPVVEAMAAGVPVITTTRGSLAEVASGAALTVEPDDTAALAAAITRLLRSKDERECARRRGLERAGEFSWRRTAELTFNAYERASRDAAPERR